MGIYTRRSGKVINEESSEFLNMLPNTICFDEDIIKVIMEEDPSIKREELSDLYVNRER